MAPLRRMVILSPLLMLYIALAKIPSYWHSWLQSQRNCANELLRVPLLAKCRWVPNARDLLLRVPRARAATKSRVRWLCQHLCRGSRASRRVPMTTATSASVTT
eukprot:2127595-Amphidinium_carterae.1